MFRACMDNIWIFISVEKNGLMCNQVYANGDAYVILCTESTTNYNLWYASTNLACKMIL